MRHRVAHRKLGRVTEHRISMLRNQATALLKHEHLTTTVPKAKELRPFVERLITVAKRGLAAGEANSRVLTARRLVMHDVQDREVVSKLFDTIAPRFAGRQGGYTRLLRIGFRRGDSAEVAQVELVGSEFDPKAHAKTEETDEAATKATGVAGRLRAAAERLRGKKDAGDRSENEAVPTRGGSKQGGAPRKKGTTGRKAGGS
jgi:large subunit ribosomal protein L17